MAERPFCVCLAGPNGSGKSTLAGSLRKFFPAESWIDPDQVAEILRRDRGLDRVSEALSAEAFRMARNRRIEFASRTVNFGFETVFSHGSNLAFLRAIKSIGYEVHFYFICTESAEINVGRVNERVQLGGHFVAEAKIRERYERALQLLSLAIRDFDRVVLFDNSQAPVMAQDGLKGGRLAFDAIGDDGGARIERANLFPPIPNWVLRYALFPYARLWQISELSRTATALFDNDVHFRPSVEFGTVAEFLEQFRV